MCKNNLSISGAVFELYDIEFRIIMVPDRDHPTVETPFIISFPAKYMARSPFGQAT
jgi:hypothetical protein